MKLNQHKSMESQYVSNQHKPYCSTSMESLNQII